MKKALLLVAILILISLACRVSVATEIPTEPAPVVTLLPATIAPTTLPTPPPEGAPSFEGIPVSFGSLSLVLPPGLANGGSVTEFPPEQGDEVPPWGATPGHTQIDLQGYLLQDKFHQPQFFIYPAEAYAELQAVAAGNIQRLRTIQENPGAPVSPETLPVVPFFNAAQLFASNIQVMPFQNGMGVRFLTEYAQYSAPVNNYELFYQFQGLTNDGKNYIIAILPATVSLLAETPDPGAPLPDFGVPYPDQNDPNADWEGYYQSVAELLNVTPAELFSPMLNQLDALIQSIQAGP